MRKTTFWLVVIGCLVLSGVRPAQAVEPGYELVKACRANLTMLNEATKQYFADGGGNFPTWSEFKNIDTMIFSTKYLPKKPVPPTPDCEYFVVFRNPENFDWYCNLHGVLVGDQSYTFRWHEFQFRAPYATKYKDNPKYRTHVDNLLRWCSYEPTLMESVKYQYARNPISTMVIAGIGLLFVWFVYRNVFGP